MMFSNMYLLAFAVAFAGCVFSTPLVTRFATWAGAIDRPDQFRRIHKGAVPRLGGLGLAVGIAACIVPVALGGFLREDGGGPLWGFLARQWSILAAAAIVLVVGLIDDTRGMSPRVKLLGQAAAVLVLIAGGLQIQRVAVLGAEFDLTSPGFLLPMPAGPLKVGLPGLAVTMLWFLGCMNVWNLIDGMDGLASGVGILVSGTLMLVAIDQGNVGSAILAAALAGSLAGFLLYNWHPACIFLGDSGSLLIGLLIGVIGAKDCLKGPSTVSILFPLLAMGLPITDTAMAIFRRWVRNLPLSSADRRHVHHLLIGLGLNPRQAAILLYCFSAFLCGSVLLGITLHNEALALILGTSGCLAFLLILTSRRDELSQLVGDLKARLDRGKQERQAAKLTWDAIQRIELGADGDAIWEILHGAATALGCDVLSLDCHRHGRPILRRSAGVEAADGLSGPSATFRLPGGDDLLLSVTLHQRRDSPLAADIAFRALQRLALATAERLERLAEPASIVEPSPSRLAAGRWLPRPLGAATAGGSWAED